MDAGRLPVLYFLHATGCEACAMMKPAVAAFHQKFGDRVRVVPIDLTRAEWQAKKWEPQITPTLVVRFPDGRISEKLEGYEPGAFTAWLRRVFG